MFGRSILRTANVVLSSSSSSKVILQTSVMTMRSMSSVAVGTKIPITFIKGEDPPVIMEDKEYPPWVFNLGDKEATKAQLMAKFGENGEGLENMTTYEKKRLKRLITLENIKDNNAASLAEQ